MAQLRLALAQVNPTVGDLAGNAALVRRWTAAGRRRRRPPGRLPRDGADRLPGRGPRAARGRSSTRPRAALDAARRRPGRRRARRPRRSSSATSTARRTPAPPCSARRQGAPAELPPRCCTAGGSSPATPSTTCRTTASSTRTATSSPGDSLTVVRVARRRRRASPSARTSGRRAARSRVAREAGAGLLLVINGSPYERNKDDVRLDAGARAGRPRPAARWPTSTWSAARTSWSSTATRWSSTPTARCWPAARSSSEDLLVVDLDLPAAHGRRRPRPAPSGVDRRHARPTEPLAAVRAAEPAPTSPSGSTDEAEVYGALVARAARLRAQERLPLGGARPVRRHRLGAGRRRSPCDALGAENVVRRLDARAATPAEHSRDDAADLAERTGLDYRVVPIAADGRRVPRRRSTLTGLAEENLQARVRGVI